MQVKKAGNTITLSDLTESEMEAMEEQIRFVEYMEAIKKQGDPDWLRKIIEEKD